MTNLEWLEKVKKADGDVDEAIKEAKKRLFADDEVIGKVIMDYRKIKALEIIAKELCLLREYKIRTPLDLNNIPDPIRKENKIKWPNLKKEVKNEI